MQGLGIREFGIEGLLTFCQVGMKEWILMVVTITAIVVVPCSFPFLPFYPSTLNSSFPFLFHFISLKVEGSGGRCTVKTWVIKGSASEFRVPPK